MLNNQLLDKLIEATRNATIAYHNYLYTDREYISGEKLYLREMHFLVFVGENKELTMSEIAEKMNVTQGAATQISSRLLKKGFLHKQKSHSDKRYSVISLTESGQKAYKEFVDYGKKRSAQIAACITDFTEKDIQTILRYEHLIVDICSGNLAPDQSKIK